MQKQVGIDEAGRGCWAGPLVAAAVALDKPIFGLNDSKQLTKRKREELAQIIKSSAHVGIGWVSASEIDEIGLTAATSRAMAAALADLDVRFDEVIIDGTYNYLPGVPGVVALAKADALIPAASAASIIAKVARDNYMNEIAPQYPEYLFEKHVGYGTALHHELLKLHGTCDLHRLSYKPVRLLVETKNV